MSRTRPPRIPKRAEGLFEGACHDAGLIANGSEDDQAGWDFVVQFPTLPGDGPADLDPVGATCLVQVKSNQTGSTTARLKLTNALRFAQEPIPCFLVLLEFDGGAATPTAAYIRHIWTADIEAALKAVRQAHVENKTALNRRSLTVRFGDEDRCDLEDMPAKMEAVVAAAGADYGARKTAIANTAGYEDGYAVGTFTFEDDVDDEAFIDLMLGRISDLPVSSISVQEQRFGLPGPQLVPEGPARLSISPSVHSRCQVVVGPTGGDGELTLDGELYVPGVPNLPESLFRIRIQTRPLEWIIRPRGQSQVNLNFDPEQALELEAIAELARLWSWVNAGPLKLALWIEGNLISHGAIDLSAKSAPRSWQRLADALDRLIQFVPARRWPANARFKPFELFQGLKTIEGYGRQISQAGYRLALGVPGSEFATLLERCRRYLGAALLDFGDATVFAVLEATIEERSCEADRCVITLGAPTAHFRAVLPGNAHSNLSFMRTQFEQLQAVHGQGGDVIIASIGELEDPEPVAALEP